MVILHVLNSLMVGGREKVVVDLCNNTDFKKNKIFIMTFSNNENVLEKELNNNVSVISLPFKNSINEQFFSLWCFGFFRVVCEIKKLNPDVIHHHLYYHHFLFLTLCLKIAGYKKANFRTVHTSGLFYNSEKIFDKFRVAIEKLATYISKPNLISISNQIYNNNFKYFGKSCSRNVKISNGIDLCRFNKSNFTDVSKIKFGMDENDIVGIYVSRLDVGKNHEMLISIWKELVEIHSNAKLLLVGDGLLMSKMVEKVNKEKLEKNILFVGYSKEVAKYISISDFGVFPSSFEGFPIALIEKMAMGLPMIVSDIDVFREVIIHDQNGKIFSNDNNSSLLFQILDLINNKDKQKYISENAIITASHYDIRNVVNKTIEFYNISMR